MTKRRYSHDITYYRPTDHFEDRFRERMAEAMKKKKKKKAIKRFLNVKSAELAKRANYMLLFSIHGRPGDTEHTEVRYYYEWNIVIDNRDRTLVTMYIDDDRPIPPVRLFGDRRLRNMVYDVWFKPKSKYRQQVENEYQKYLPQYA